MSSVIAGKGRLAFLLVLAAALLTLLVVAPAAKADPQPLAGGSTVLKTDSDTTKVLIQNQIVPTPVRPAKWVPRWGYYWRAKHGFAIKYRFPITGGQIDPANLAGEIEHSGGLKFRNLKNGTSLKVTDFTIDTVNAQLTAMVGDARVPILDLDLSNIKVRERGRYTIISGVGATLTGVAADALNATLQTDIFAEGLKLGTASVKARFAKLLGGSTILRTDGDTTKVLVQNRIIPTPVRPARWVPRWGYYWRARHGFVIKYRFPITGGQIDPNTLAGEIDHSGGLKFRNLRNGTHLKVTDFIIDTVNAELTAMVGGARVAILDLDLSGIKVRERGRYTIISGVGATLTDVAADALNATLQTDIFAGGLKLGTATVKARIAK